MRNLALAEASRGALTSYLLLDMVYFHVVKQMSKSPTELILVLVQNFPLNLKITVF